MRERVLQDLGFAGNIVGATVLRVVEQGKHGVKKAEVKREREAYGLLRTVAPHAALLFPDIVLPDMGETRSALYMTMPLCDGGNITKHKFDGFEEVLDLFQALAGGVQHLHDHEIVHFDIKGENVLVRKQSVVAGRALHSVSFVLSDFGVAEHCTEGKYAGLFNGTDGEVAPEMQRLFNGGRAEIDGFKCDVYGIGRSVDRCMKDLQRQSTVDASEQRLIEKWVKLSMHASPDHRPSAGEIFKQLVSCEGSNGYTR